MTRKLQKHGNSVALVFDKSMLEALNMTPDTPVVITLHGGVMTVAPANAEIPRDQLDATLQRIRPRYKKMLENLAQ